MKKPRKLERFDAKGQGWVMNWTEHKTGAEIKSYRIIAYKNRAYEFEYREIFFEPIPQYSIILN